MAGGKGGSSTTTVEVPEYIEEAAKRNLARADVISQIGYVPYYGADVAAFTPLQEAAFQNVAGQAGAFGLATPAGGAMSGMPAPQEFAGGIRGYSSAPMYEEALGELARRRPAQFNLIESLFINPVTGQFGLNTLPTSPITITPTDTTTIGGGGTGSVTDFVDTGGVGQTGGTGFTTYGGSQTAAHDMIDQAFIDYGKQITAKTARPEDNPAYNPEIAAANVNVPVTYRTDSGDTVTKPAGQLTVEDFKKASNDPMTQYQLAGMSMAAAGIRNVGGSYAQGDPTTGITGVAQDIYGYLSSPDVSATGYMSGTQADREAAMGLDPFGGAGLTVDAEDTFGADLYRSLTDPYYDPEGTVLSRALGGILTPSASSSQPTRLETLGDFVQAAPSMGMTATEAGIAYQESKGVDDRPYDPFYDTKVKDPISGKTLTPFQLNNRINSPNLGKAYADAGITNLDQALTLAASTEAKKGV